MMTEVFSAAVDIFFLYIVSCLSLHFLILIFYHEFYYERVHVIAGEVYFTLLCLAPRQTLQGVLSVRTYFVLLLLLYYVMFEKYLIKKICEKRFEEC